MESRVEGFSGHSEDVLISQLMDFAKSKGWSCVEKSPVTYFLSPKDSEGNRLRYSVPIDKSFSDFKNRVHELIIGIARFQKSHAQDVWSDLSDSLKNPIRSVQASLRIRTETPASARNSISLEGIERVIDHGKQIIAHGVSMELDKPKPWRHSPLKRASDSAGKFEFAQTERGSFIVVIRTPAEVSRQMSFVKEEPPVEVKAIVRLARGLEWIDSHDVEDPKVDLTSMLSFGINSNIADHLAAMRDELGGGNLDIVFGLSEEIRKEQKLQSQTFTIGGVTSAKLKAVSEVLKRAVEVDIELEARITALASKDPAQEELSRKVTFETLPNQKAGTNFGNKKFTLELNREQYLKAAAAHTEGKYVTISGQFSDGPAGLTLKKLSKVSFHK